MKSLETVNQISCDRDRPSGCDAAILASPSRIDQHRQFLSVAGQVDWQTAMKRAVRTREDLLDLVGLGCQQLRSEDSAEQTPIAAETRFATFAPLEFIQRIEPGNPDDPLLRQVLAIKAEDLPAPPGFCGDPVGDHQATVAGGLLHKYHGRALLITTGACGIHCRYCFRREFPYSQTRPHDWAPAIDYLKHDPSIQEILLSGGDPLTLVDDKLFELIDRLEAVASLRRLRIHSRMPIVIPNRTSDGLVARLRRSRLSVWLVVHCNHGNELDRPTIDGLAKWIDAGIPVLNQAVLLKGVNDSVKAMEELSTRLVDHRVMPYYLHQLDRVVGAGHFEVNVETGKQIIEQLRQRLPGYAVPQFVSEQPGQPSKTPIPM